MQGNPGESCRELASVHEYFWALAGRLRAINQVNQEALILVLCGVFVFGRCMLPQPMYKHK